MYTLIRYFVRKKQVMKITTKATADDSVDWFPINARMAPIVAKTIAFKNDICTGLKFFVSNISQCTKWLYSEVVKYG